MSARHRAGRGAGERLWTPPGRTPRQLRNARVKVVGSVLLLGLLALGVVLALPL